MQDTPISHMQGINGTYRYALTCEKPVRWLRDLYLYVYRHRCGNESEDAHRTVRIWRLSRYPSSVIQEYWNLLPTHYQEIERNTEAALEQNPVTSIKIFTTLQL